MAARTLFVQEGELLLVQKVEVGAPASEKEFHRPHWRELDTFIRHFAGESSPVPFFFHRIYFFTEIMILSLETLQGSPRQPIASCPSSPAHCQLSSLKTRNRKNK
jgi:hypothetical protein